MKSWLHLYMISGLCMQNLHVGFQIRFGKFLESLGEELRVGRIWGREGPQWSKMLWSPPSKVAFFSRRIDILSLEMSYNSRGSLVQAEVVESLTPN